VNPRQHAQRREAILRAAATEIAAHGVDGTTTAAICRRAGIGSGTLFHYFPTKRDIVHALFADDLPRLAALRRRALAADPAAGLGLLLDHLLGELADPLAPGLAAAAVFQANRDAAFAAVLTANDDLVRAALTAVLARLAAAGRPLAFPPDRTARWIQHLIDSSHLAAGDPDHDPAAQLAELRRIIGWLTGSDQQVHSPR
jgi:AcrR family transcriptional regulator